jgi:glutathione-regulated potassium-efflux system protein KefB
MAAEAGGSHLVDVVVLLGAGIAAVTLFKRLGLGSVLGYFAAGLAIGPFGLGLFSHPESILHVAELGVVMFLFLIGLEMRPSRLWSMRREIFGLGVAQVGTCTVLLTFVGVASGLGFAAAFIAAAGFVLSSTAAVMQTLAERGETSTPRGQQAVSILLLEDLAIVPLLAIVALMAPAASDDGSRWLDVAIALGALLALLAAGRWLLNPLFRVFANAGAREVMTAAALLLVLGTALLMQYAGLSMAMGAFLAGVLLSESTFRHQLEADVEPFRGILLGLFFLSVGMSLDVSVLRSEWHLVAAGALACMSVKALGVYAIARLRGTAHGDGLHRALLMAQGGEFAFVLYAAATGAGIFDPRINALLTAIVIVSMALTPLAMLSLRWLAPRADEPLDGVDEARGLHGNVLIIGFGRFGQVASQSLLARGFDVTIIDTDIEMIRGAADFGFKVYYGDGTRLDVLHASGAGEAQLIAVCVDDTAAANRIAELVLGQFPLARLLVRAFDREHALHLIHRGVDRPVRETFESAVAFGEAALVALGVPETEAAGIAAEVRRRDAERLDLEVSGGIGAGNALLLGNAPKPAPLTPPRHPVRPLNEEAAAATRDAR